MADTYKIQLIINALNQSADHLQALKNQLGDIHKDTTKASAAFGNLDDSIKKIIKTYLSFEAVWKLAEFTKDTAFLAARVETLGVTMHAAGRNVGYTAEQLDAFAAGIEKKGITTEESRQAVLRMIQANLDLTKSEQLARIAQDAAVIANTNSSEAFGNMILGLSTGQAIILHHMGLMVNFEGAYMKLSRQLGKTTNDLTEEEKAHARLNEVVRVSTNIQGSYEAAMETAGKQLTSLKRYSDQARLALGEVFKPLLGEVVKEATESLKNIEKFFKDNPQTVRQWGATLVEIFYNAKAEVLRLGALLDRIGQGAAWGGMLLFGPGAALGNKNSQAQFEKFAQMATDFENRYNEKDKELQDMANRLNGLLEKIMNPPAPKKEPAPNKPPKPPELQTGDILGPAVDSKTVEKLALAWKAAQEAELSYKLYLIDIAEQNHEVSKSEATEQRIALMKEMLSIQETHLGFIDRLKDPTGWYTQQKEIGKTREELLKLNRQLKEQTGTFMEGMDEGLKQYLESVKTTFQSGVELSKETAQAMERAFSDYFFDAMTGKLKHFSDYIKAFLESIARAIANMMAQKAAAGIVASVASAGSGSGEVSFHRGGLVMHQGGYVPRFHFGGLAPDERPAILQTGEGVLSRKGMAALAALNNGHVKSGDVNIEIKVENQTGQAVTAQQGDMKFDGEKWVLSVVMKGLEYNYPFRQAMAGVKR